ncbi:hypothetical protein [Devriesea agamarum]|uniref:hypothetical protein n=1 Tax=Devriesea agamarum TaxID=472569 RepID=UPI00071C7600|nr:hypothetical protein [Devriesea agamarum]
MSWTKVGQRIEAIELVRVQPVEAEPKRFFESKAAYAQRVETAQQATAQAELKAVAAKCEQRLAQAVPPRNLGAEIRGVGAAQQRAQVYRKRQAQRREWLSMVGRVRQVCEPEGGWRSLRQIDNAVKKQGVGVRAGKPQDKAHTLSEFQARQRRVRSPESRRGLTR